MSHQRWNFPEILRERGFRVTPQRLMILDAVCEGGGHTTPDEVYQRLHSKSPSINRATVYRTLDLLCDMQLLVAAVIGGHMVYEIAGETPHHHLVCRNCSKTEPLSHELVQAWFRTIKQQHYFTVGMDHLILFGLCKECDDGQIQPGH